MTENTRQINTEMPEVFLIINMQIGFMNNSTQELPERIRVALSENSGVYPIFTKFVSEPKDDGRLDPYLGMQEADPNTLICPELLEFSSDKAITTKNPMGLNLGVLEKLKSLNSKTVYLCGLSTDTSIITAGQILLEFGFNPIVLADYCASENGSMAHFAGLSLIARSIGSAQIYKGKYTQARAN